MFAREVQQPFDFNLGAWRELEITRAVSDLVVQFVTPSFALYNQWSYVEHAGPGMFENAAMHERYARSRRLAGAVEGLRAGRHALDALDAPNARDPGAADSGMADLGVADLGVADLGVADLGAPNPATLNLAMLNPATLNLPLQNYHTEELSSHIYEALDYAQSFLLTSDVAMMHTMEDVGRTLQSWPAYIRGAGDPTPAAIALFANAGNAARVLFEYAYGVHCLHTLVGVAHGDLHSNNLTVFEWGRIEAVDRKAPPRADGRRTFTSMYEDPVVIYATGTRADTTIEDIYMFPADGISGALIDYSRAIVGPAFRSRLEAGRSAQYATNFYRDQVNRAMRTLHRYAPEYVAAHQDELKGIAYADFDSLFAVRRRLHRDRRIGRRRARGAVDCRYWRPARVPDGARGRSTRARPRGRRPEGARRRPARAGRLCARKTHGRQCRHCADGRLSALRLYFRRAINRRASDCGGHRGGHRGRHT
jgi:hypothetical protein